MNVANVYQGSTDVPVGKRGMEELLKAPAHPEVERVFSSPMLRTRQTAGALFPNARLVLVDGLREMDFGDFEGKTGREVENQPAYEHWKRGGYDARCPNGESILELGQRVIAAFDRIVDEAKDGEKVYVVAHGGVIMALMSMFAGDISDYFSFRARNLHGYSATLDKDEWQKSRRFKTYREYSALEGA